MWLDWLRSSGDTLRLQRTGAAQAKSIIQQAEAEAFRLRQEAIAQGSVKARSAPPGARGQRRAFTSGAHDCDRLYRADSRQVRIDLPRALNHRRKAEDGARQADGRASRLAHVATEQHVATQHSTAKHVATLSSWSSWRPSVSTATGCCAPAACFGSLARRSFAFAHRTPMVHSGTRYIVGADNDVVVNL
jgi:hypothetical protein